MINHYPLWKNLLIVLVIAVGIVYALPNIYPNDFAIQVSHTSGSVDESLEAQIVQTLESNDVAVKAVEREPDKVLVRLNDDETQLKASDLVKNALTDRHIVALNLAPTTPSWLRGINALPMNLGLDLRGGVHFLLEVDMDAALTKALDSYEGEFRDVMREEKIRYLTVKRDGDIVSVKFKDEATRDAGLKKLKNEYRADLAVTENESEGAFLVSASLHENTARELKEFALQQNLTTLRKRVNELGVAEPLVQRQGDSRVVVQLPGVQDTARAKEILGATATLEFRLVDEQNDPYLARDSGRIPVGSQLYYERNGEPVLLKRRVMLTGDYITDAASGIDSETATPNVSITLDGKGARIFSKVTGENVQKLMAVVFIENKTETVVQDGKSVRKSRKTEEVISIARIQEQLGKLFQITGLDSPREARNLALLLRAGALAAPMEIIEERTVGPSLGQQNIDQGMKSVVIGFVLVVIFMAIYYRVFGLVANLALATNLVMIVAVMSMLGATLTLPGIAGIVLTVGMAVDANVLIFERIREELRNGNSPQASIFSGYQKALSTIADANITTLIAAVVLFGFGTGPIKGFAVTLMIGIVSSMFTAIMGTRAIINLIYGNKRSPKLAI